MKIIERAGLKPWPKLWQNLRATRATELVSEGWPEYKVCKWMGHTKLVAEKSYWQVTDDDFTQAAHGIHGTEIRGPNMAQPASVRARNASSKKSKSPVFPEKNEVLLTCTNVQVGGNGLEPSTPSLSSWCSNQLS